jgi:hypothetical protein
VEIEGDYYQGTVKSVPVEPTIPNYQISFPDSPESLEVPLNKLTAPDEPVFQLIEADQTITDEAFPSLPKWIRDGIKVTLFHDGGRRRGTISSTDQGWVFEQRTASGRTTYKCNLADLPVTWKERLSKGTFELGWQEASERAYYVSAKGLSQGVPASFQ